MKTVWSPGNAFSILHEKKLTMTVMIALLCLLFLSNLSKAEGALYIDSTTGMEMVFVKGGCFEMGDTVGDGTPVEKPVHEVCVDDFSIGKYDVTVGQFKKFVNDTGYRTEAEKGDGCYGWTGSEWEKQSNFNWKKVGFSQDDSHPVVCVSWNDAKAYAEWQSKRSGKSYRLPTEAEWEYAARGGTKGRNFWGDSQSAACKYANVPDLSFKRQFSNSLVHDCDDGYVFTSPVGSFQPNGYGLYDMMGNVWQWLEDWYGEKYYGESPRNNPSGPMSGRSRVVRGGSWLINPSFMRTSLRTGVVPSDRSDSSGFRLAYPSR